MSREQQEAAGGSQPATTRAERMIAKAKRRLREVDARIALALSSSPTRSREHIDARKISAPIVDPDAPIPTMRSKVSEDVLIALQRSANAGKPGFEDVQATSTPPQDQASTYEPAYVPVAADSSSSFNTSTSTYPSKPISVTLESISENVDDHRPRSAAPSDTTTVNYRSLDPRLSPSNRAEAADASRLPTHSPSYRKPVFTSPPAGQTSHDAEVLPQFTPGSRLSHADLLQRIEDELMQETPLEFAESSVRSRERGSSDGSGVSKSSSSSGGATGVYRPPPRSVSDPVNLSRLTVDPVSVQRKADAPLLSAIIDHRRQSSEDERSLPLTQPLEIHGEPMSLADDMENLLREVRDFRGRVASIRSTVSNFPNSSDIVSTAPPTPPLSTTATSMPQYQQQQQTLSVPEKRSSKQHAARASTATMMTDYGRLSQFSLHSPNQENVLAAYGGQQPSSVYIPSSQAKRIAQELGDEGTMLAPPPPIDLMGPGRYEPEEEEEEELETDFITQRGSQRKGRQFAQEEEEQTITAADEELYVVKQRSAAADEELHVVKQRSSSSFSQTRPDSRPRGPRALSTSSLSSMRQQLAQAAEISAAEDRSSSRMQTQAAGGAVDRARTDSDERKSFVTAASSVPQSEESDVGEEGEEEEAVVDESMLPPPEVPRRSSGRAHGSRSKQRSISFDTTPRISPAKAIAQQQQYEQSQRYNLQQQHQQQQQRQQYEQAQRYTQRYNLQPDPRQSYYEPSPPPLQPQPKPRPRSHADVRTDARAEMEGQGQAPPRPRASYHQQKGAGVRQRATSEGNVKFDRRRAPRATGAPTGRQSHQYSSSMSSSGSPIRERKSTHTSIYSQPRDAANVAPWFLDKETDNLDWLGKGAEFDELINLELEHKRMLEKFIETLGRLSVDVAMDEKKRDEGRRRMDNALLALEGWI